ncbi:MAG: 30S ribosomal protein S1 [Anaerolineae bacterium]
MRATQEGTEPPTEWAAGEGASHPEAEESPHTAGAPSMADFLEGEFDFQEPRRGEIRKGYILSIGPEGAVVDVGLKREALVPASDLDHLDKESREALKEGDEVYVAVLRPHDRDGNLIVSIFRARLEEDWIRAQQSMESKQLLELVPAEYNRGGLVVRFGKIRGFVPASQLMRFPRRLSENQKTERLKAFVEAQEPIPLKIVEVDRRRRRLIFSQREAWWEWKEQRKRALLSQLKEGQEVEGTVTSLRDFGAFVDLGGADGLIHVSELSWQHVDHPREVLKVGQKVRAKVLNLDPRRLRIGLSLKQMEPEPWERIDEIYQEGQLVEGVVTRVADFGAFVRLSEGIEGLVHVSELADIEPERPGDLVSEGDLLLLRIIRIEPDRRRIGLSLRQVTEQEWSDWVATFEQEEEGSQKRLEEEGVPQVAGAGGIAEPEDSVEVQATQATEEEVLATEPVANPAAEVETEYVANEGEQETQDAS